MDQPAAQPHAARHDAIDFEAAVPLQPHLDDRVAGCEIGALGIADHQVVDFLRAQPDAIEMVCRLDPSPLELALEEVGRDRPPLDPDDRDRDQHEQQHGECGDARDARPAQAAAHHHRLFIIPPLGHGLY